MTEPQGAGPARAATASRSGEVAGYAMLGGAMLFLACNHVIGRSVRADIPPLGLNFWRWCVAALVLAPFIGRGMRVSAARFRAHWRDVALLGALMIGSTGLVLVALNFTTAINVSLLNALQPALTVLLARVFLHEVLSVRQGVGVLAALAGMLAMITKADWDVVRGLQFNGGDLIALAAMVGFSTYAIRLPRLSAEFGLVEGLFWIVVAGCTALLPFYLVESVVYQPMPLTVQSVTVVITLAIMVSILFMLLWNAGNRRIGPSRAAVFINLVPVFGAILAVIFLGERIAVYHLAGAALVGCGIWLVVRRAGAH